MTNANVAALLTAHAASHGEKTALVDLTRRKPRRLSFNELERAAAAFAERLREGGVQPGDRVLIFVPMSAELYVTLLGVLRLGATAVFVDAWADRRRLDLAVETAAPKAFVGSRKAQALRLLSPALRRLPLHVVADEALLKDLSSNEPVAEVSPDAPALVTLTTGSTGAPRAAARSHAFLLAQHRALAGLMRLRPDDIDLTTLPIFVLNNLALGITTVLPPVDPRRPSDFDAAALFRILQDEGVSTLGGSPAFFERLCVWANQRGRRLPIRALFTGGAPVMPSLAREIVRSTTGEATVVYGSTEAEPISSFAISELLDASESEGASAGLCVGTTVPEAQVRLVRPCDDPIELGESGWLRWEVGTGEIGEIVVAGEHVLGGYLNDPEGDRRGKIREGSRVWHRTGDAARFDEVGRLWLQGRVADRIIRENKTYWTLPAEMAAAQCPEVRHAAYVSLPHSPDTAVLCIETADGRPAPGVREALSAAGVEAPMEAVVALKRIPRDPRHASKTDVTRLRAVLAGRRLGRSPDG